MASGELSGRSIALSEGFTLIVLQFPRFWATCRTNCRRGTTTSPWPSSPSMREDFTLFQRARLVEFIQSRLSNLTSLLSPQAQGAFVENSEAA